MKTAKTKITVNAATKARKAKAGKPDKTKAEAAAKPAKLSALDAAVKVLAETGQAMTCKELIEAMLAKGYWTSPNGLTPAATLSSAIQRELKTKGANSRFQKTERGKFAATGQA